MTLYPDLPGPRAQAITRDALLVILLVVFAWLGVRVHDAVGGLQSVGTGVSQAGTSVQQGFASAAAAVSGVPIVGGSLAHDLRSASGATGGQLVALGHDGNAAIRHLATVLGLTTWAVPSLLFLALALPPRLREVRRLRAMRSALSGPDALARRRLLAFRAVARAPVSSLLAVSEDPVADLLAGRTEALAAAALEAEGVSASV
jgi:hypothetical protein